MAHERRFRFGVSCTTGASQREFTEKARRIEAEGFSTLFVPDHFVEHDLAPTIGLAHAAAVTSSLRVGPFVLGNDYKHPVVCAREMASLDRLSDGRLELGIGAGWMTVDYEKSGIPLDRPGVRIARLAEAVSVLKGLFAPGPFSFAGEHYRITDLDGRPEPVQQPVPFLIGGGGPKVLGLAAREAQIVGINANLASGAGDTPETRRSLTPAATDEKVGWVRDAAGGRFDDLELQMLVGFVHIGPDASGVLEGIAGFFGIGVEEARMLPVCLIAGSPDEAVEVLEARRARWQVSYFVVDETALDAFAPVVGLCAGR